MEIQPRRNQSGRQFSRNVYPSEDSRKKEKDCERTHAKGICKP